MLCHTLGEGDRDGEVPWERVTGMETYIGRGRQGWRRTLGEGDRDGEVPWERETGMEKYLGRGR